METTTNTRKQESGKVFTMKKAVGIIGICLAIWGLYAIISLFVDYKSSETTEDAQVEQYLSPVNIRVPGYIKKIYFTEHQHVRKGDTLLVLEDDEYRVEQLEKDYRRYSSLLKKNATTPIVVEQYQTQLEMARARVAALKQQREAAHSSVTEVDQRQENAEAAVKRAEAAVDLASLNLSYTVVTAPCNGCLGRRSIEEGQLVNAGQTLTTIIPDTRKWVVANYKETQISSLAVGQEVEVTVDAFAGKTFKGRITAISSATGSKYSMVPTDNSAGNFVKIQQRVPVRIELTDISDEDNARLAAGMMCVVKANL